MFIQINTLPGTQREAPLADRQGQAAARDNTADVGGHVIISFRGVGEIPVAINNRLPHPGLQVPVYGRICIFAEDQGGTGVMDEKIAQSGAHSGRVPDLMQVPGYVICAAAVGVNPDFVLVYHQIIAGGNFMYLYPSGVQR